MGAKNLISLFISLLAFPATAQIFNFSLRTNNQQLIDKALMGAFVRINQSYELCDTIKDEHFGRGGKDYFSIIPFIGVETQKGLVFPASVLTPWNNDGDFVRYKERYKPLLTKTTVTLLNSVEKYPERDISPINGTVVTKNICALTDTIHSSYGLTVDSLPGKKDGWFIWISSNQDLTETDTVKFTSIKKDIDVPEDGQQLSIDTPEISETVYGGIYITPTQSAIGQLTFTITGVMLLDEGGWTLDFPFIKDSKEKKPLTPIKGITDESKINPLKSKKKK